MTSIAEQQSKQSVVTTVGSTQNLWTRTRAAIWKRNALYDCGGFQGNWHKNSDETVNNRDYTVAEQAPASELNIYSSIQVGYRSSHGKLTMLSEALEKSASWSRDRDGSRRRKMNYRWNYIAILTPS